MTPRHASVIDSRPGRAGATASRGGRRGDAGGPPLEVLIITLSMMIFTLIALAVLAHNVFQAADLVP
jgi:hypothetical protein